MTESNLRIGVGSRTPTERKSAVIASSGSPRQLTDHELRRLRRTPRGAPREAGYSVAAWTVRPVQRYIEDGFDATHPFQSVERPVKAVGVAHRLEGRNV